MAGSSAAPERAGITVFRLRDLRRGSASRYLQSRAPLSVLQELGGCASTEMVRRYAHLAADHLASYAERLGTIRTSVVQTHGTNPSQPG